VDEEASIILGDAIAFCQRDGQDARLINMLGQSRAISLTEDTLTIEAPSRFAIAQLKKHQPTIEAYLEEIAFAPIALDIVAPQGAATESAAATAPATLLPRRCRPPQATRRQSSTSTVMFPVKPWHHCRPRRRRQRTHPSRTCPSLTTQRRALIRALQSRTRSRPMIFVA
jgi:chromosomal replication initiation ATPase DnaA